MLGIGHPTTCVYQFLTGGINSNDVLIIQWFILSVLDFNFIIQTQYDHLYYAFSLSNNKYVTIVKVNDKL